MEKFSNLVKKELSSARSKHGKQHSLHEGYGILLEEVDELWDEIKKKSSQRDLDNLLNELVQIGSCAQKMAEDTVIPLLKKKK